MRNLGIDSEDRDDDIEYDGILDDADGFNRTNIPRKPHKSRLHRLNSELYDLSDYKESGSVQNERVYAEKAKPAETFDYEAKKTDTINKTVRSNADKAHGAENNYYERADDSSEFKAKHKNASSDMAKNESKKKRANAATAIIIVIAAVVMIVAVYNLVDIGSDYADDANLYESLRSYAQTLLPEETEGTVEGRLLLDFNSLRMINSDIVGWIDIPGTTMSYPIVQGYDNEYYLTHGFDKQERKSGAVYMDVMANPGFTDTNTILYGHNMKDGSMFAMLHNYEKQDYYDEHPNVYIYLPDGAIKEYIIFSAYETDDDSSAYIGGNWDKQFYDEYVLSALKNSQIECLVFPSYGDDLILLSTCVRGSENTRYVVHAAEI